MDICLNCYFTHIILVIRIDDGSKYLKLHQGPKGASSVSFSSYTFFFLYMCWWYFPILIQSYIVCRRTKYYVCKILFFNAKWFFFKIRASTTEVKASGKVFLDWYGRVETVSETCMYCKVFATIRTGWSPIRELVASDVTYSQSCCVINCDHHAVPSYAKRFKCPF